MAPILPGGPATVAALAGSLLLAAFYCWNRFAQLSTKYGDPYTDYRSYLWSEFSSALGDLVTEINQLTDYEPEDDEDDPIPPKSEVVTAINNEIGRDRLSDIEDFLRDVDEPRELKTKIREKLKRTFLYLIGSSISFFVLAFLLLAPANENIIVLQFIMGMAGIVTIIESAQAFYSAWKAESELDDLISEYQEPI